MTRWLLTAMLLLTLAGSAFAQSQQVQNMGGWYRNPQSGQVTDSNGNAYTTEAYPAMDANFTFTSIIANDSLAIATADSSAVLDTRHMRLGTLLMEISPRSFGIAAPDTGRTFTMIVQIRTHLNAGTDSSSVFPLYLYGQNTGGVSATGADTTGAGHLFEGNAFLPFSGEYTFYFSLKRNGMYNNLSINGRNFYYPKGVAIPLSSLFGRDIYSPYTSIRIRNATVGGSVCKVRVHLVGTPL